MRTRVVSMLVVSALVAACSSSSEGDRCDDCGSVIPTTPGRAGSGGSAGAGGKAVIGAAGAPSAGTGGAAGGAVGSAGAAGGAGAAGTAQGAGAAGAAGMVGSQGGSAQAGGAAGAPVMLSCDPRFTVGADVIEGKPFDVSFTDTTPYVNVALRLDGAGSPTTSWVGVEGNYTWTWRVSGHAPGVLAMTFARDETAPLAGVALGECEVLVAAKTTGAGGMTSGSGCTPSQVTDGSLGLELLIDPVDPHPGDTLVVIARTTSGTKVADAPQVDLDITTAAGTVTLSPTLVTPVAPADTGYYFALAQLPEGAACLSARGGSSVYASAQIATTPRPAVPAPSGVFKVIEHHQLTCDEQPDWGNELHVEVQDENGNGVAGAVVAVTLPAMVDLGSIKNGSEHPVPTSLTMNGEGRFDDYFWWPSSGTGLLTIELAVDGVASDLATEISSGWWETDANGCRYCNNGTARNVYGHWSHRIVFRRDPSATQACVVSSDHAGMAACGPTHAYHQPDATSCWSVP